MTNKDQTVLDIVSALNREFRFNPSFMLMVHPLDEEEARRVAQLYIEWTNRVLQSEYENNQLDFNFSPRDLRSGPSI